jgi:hypothetical protein
MRGSREVICRLALAVVIGTLQYLVPATRNAIGASFLNHVYRNIHNENLDNFENIHDLYHSGLTLGALAQTDFCWWEQALNSGLREQVQPRYFCTLGVAWGDGIGSGSGSTFEWVESGKGVLPKMEAWIGDWTEVSGTCTWVSLGSHPCPRNHYDHTGYRLSRGIWANGFNTDFKYFAVEVFLPDLTSISLTHWDLRRIGIQAEHVAWWNVETGTSSWAPTKLMHTHTFWILSPGVSRQGFTAAIMVWVESP